MLETKEKKRRERSKRRMHATQGLKKYSTSNIFPLFVLFLINISYKQTVYTHVLQLHLMSVTAHIASWCCVVL